MSEGVKTALTTAFTGVKTDVLSIVEIAVPAALAIVAVTMAIKIGVGFFRSIAKAQDLSQFLHRCIVIRSGCSIYGI